MTIGVGKEVISKRKERRRRRGNRNVDDGVNCKYVEWRQNHGRVIKAG